MEYTMNRRRFLKKGASGLITTAALAGVTPYLFAKDDTVSKPVRIGIIGSGHRGTDLIQLLLGWPDVSVNAICDINKNNLNHAIEIVKKIKGNTPAGYSGGEFDYRNMLKRDDFDAVLIASPQQWHTVMAIDSMKAGKHVGSEVAAGWELEQLLELVKVKESTGKRYMLLENYVYTRMSLMIYNMVQKGIFGNSYYSESAYIHRTPELYFNSDGTLTWRGHLFTDTYGNFYPTHALGPVSKWFGINDGDRFDYCVSMMSEPPQMMHKYAVERCGPESDAAKQKYISGEITPVYIKTVKGKIIHTINDAQSPRPATNYYLLQGTNGIYDSRAGIFIDGESENYRNADDYLAKYEHSYWKEYSEQAKATGHSGGDYFVMKDFHDMVLYDREPWIDVYDAVAWSAIVDCSKMSISQKGERIKIPDFTGGKWEKADWRKSNMKPA